MTYESALRLALEIAHPAAADRARIMPLNESGLACVVGKDGPDDQWELIAAFVDESDAEEYVVSETPGLASWYRVRVLPSPAEMDRLRARNERIDRLAETFDRLMGFPPPEDFDVEGR